MAIRDVTPEELGQSVLEPSAPSSPALSSAPIEQDVAEDMHTFPSIDKKNYFENPDADLFSRMQQADATVFQGNFVSEAGERAYRGFAVGGLKTLSDLAELTGDVIIKGATPADNPRANIFGHKVRNFGFHLQKQADAILEERRKTNPIDEGITPTGFATDVVSSTLTNIGLVAGGTAIGVAAGAPVLTAAAVARVGVAGAYGAQAGLEQYSGARAAGNTFESSLAYGIASGVLNTGLELVGLNKVFKTTYVKGVGIVTRRIAEAMAAEGLTEGLQEDVGIALDAMSGADTAQGRKLSVVDIAAQTIYASAVGAVSGGGMAAAVSIPQRAKAISVLKQAGMDDAKAREVYKTVSQEVMDVMHKDLTDEFGFDDAQNMVVQKAMDAATGYRVSEFFKRQQFSRGDFETQLSEMEQADPARELLLQIKTEAAATVRGDAERVPDANIPGSSDAFAAQETLKQAQAFQPKPVADLQVRQPEFNASTTEEMRLAISGRISFLNEKMTGLQKERSLLQKEVDRLELELGQKRASGVRDRSAMEAELEVAMEKENKVANDIVRAYVEAEGIRSNQEGVSLKGNEVQLSTRDLIRVTSGFARRILQTANQNFRNGVTASKAEMRFIRQTLNSLINIPGLSRDTRAILKSQFRNLDTAEKFYKNLPLIEMTVQDAQNESLIGSFMRGVDKIVDVFKGKEGAGKGGLRAVKLDAESQKVADAFVKEYEKEDANPVDRLREAGTSAIGAIRFMAAQLKSGKNAVTGRDLEPADYASIYETLYDFARNGRESKLFNVEVEKETVRIMAERVTSDILAGKSNMDREMSNADWVDHILLFATNTFGTYGGFTGLIARHGAEMIGGDTATQKLLSMDASLRKAEALQLFFRGEVDRAYLDSYPELKGDVNAIYQQREKDSDINGPRAVSISFMGGDKKTEYDFNYTREEAMEKYMISLRPEGEAKMRKLGWTDEGFALLRDSLSASDMKFIEAKFKIYSELYDRLNEVFRKLAGYDLPRSKNYSPLITDRDVDEAGSLLAALYNDGKSQAEHMASLQSSGFLQTATDSKVELKSISSVDKLNRYIRDVTHYIGTAEALSRIQTVLNNRDVKNAVKSRYGEITNQQLKRYVNVLVKNTVSSEADHVFHSVNKAVTRLAQGLIAAKPFQVIKQMTSAFAGAEVMGFPKYFQYLSTLPEAIRTGEVRVLTDSSYIRNRSQSRVIDRDTRAIQEMMEFDRKTSLIDNLANPEMKEALKKFDKMLKNPTFNNLLFLPTQLGDIGGLLMSSWPVYKHYLAEGDTPAVAKTKAIAHANSTQQSGDFTQLPAWMLNANPVQRLFTLFTQAPYQYMNRALRVMQKAGTDRWDWDEFAKMYAVFFLVLPALFDYVSNVFKLDKDARLYAAQKAALGPFDELVIAGPMLEWAVVHATAGLLSKVTGEEVKAPAWSVQNISGLAGSFAGNVVQTQKALIAIAEEGISAESVLKLVTEASEASLPLTGSAGGAVRQVSNSLEGLVLGSQGDLVDTWRRYFMVLGASRNITKETK